MTTRSFVLLAGAVLALPARAAADAPALPVRTVVVRQPGGRPHDEVQHRPAGQLRPIDRPLPGPLPAARLHEQLHRLGPPRRAGQGARAVRPDRRHARRRQLVVRQLGQERGRAEERLGGRHRQGPDRPRGRDLPDDRPARGAGDQRPVDGRLRRPGARPEAPGPVLFGRQPQRGRRLRHADRRAAQGRQAARRSGNGNCRKSRTRPSASRGSAARPSGRRRGRRSSRPTAVRRTTRSSWC